jgi:peroxiredoxin Q/BCP
MAALGTGVAKAAPLSVGDMAPDVSIASTAGGQMKLADYRGKKNVVLAFFPKAFTGG